MLSMPIAYLNSNNDTSMLAFGKGDELIAFNNAIDRLEEFIEAHKGNFIFGYLSYDLKNEIENLASSNFDGHNFPRLHFWVPEFVVEINESELVFRQGTRSKASEKFVVDFLNTKNDSSNLCVEFKARTPKDKYIQNVINLKQDIKNGNIYETNYCQEYYAENVEIDNPVSTYFRLNHITEAPFSCYLSMGDHQVFSGSPERFIQKVGQKVISSPIKGTCKRGLTAEEDEINKSMLLNDPKERSENVMIVDLVRNDLSRIASKGSVNVDELFSIHTYKTVHQMVSTISCTLKENIRFAEILRATFPMGSMTGAPKISAMQHIEQYEDFQRGLYSGSVGYIAPNGDFDFNVIIRSLLYNKKTKYLSCPVGGAITIKSDPEKEYEECQVKISKILNELHAEA